MMKLWVLPTVLSENNFGCQETGTDFMEKNQALIRLWGGNDEVLGSSDCARTKTTSVVRRQAQV